ncbi:hypothetical protein NW752_007632, partial [Fusarium irregulare]
MIPIKDPAISPYYRRLYSSSIQRPTQNLVYSEKTKRPTACFVLHLDADPALLVARTYRAYIFFTAQVRKRL